jgi:phage/plasmid-like protein (TIGR03299 family)
VIKRRKIMSHEVETMAFAGEVPWHGLGTPVAADLSAHDMMVAAGLDWEVRKYALKSRIIINGKTYEVTAPGGKKGLYRIHKDGRAPDPLDVVGKDWEPVQNAEAFEFFHDFVKAGDMEMHTAGSLRDGRIVWALAKIKESFEAVKGDVIDNYMLFTNPHVYGRPTDVRMTPIRVVCNNTLTMALNKKANSNQMVSVNHREKFDAGKVKTLLGIAHSHFADYQEVARYLAGRKAPKEKMSEYFNLVFPRTSDAKGANQPSKQHDRAMAIVDQQPGHQYAPGTWWQALNAVTYIVDHEMGKDASRLDNAWYGSNRVRKLKALSLAGQMAA